MSEFANLAEWLEYIESLSLSEVKLSLDRITKVATKLKILKPSFKIICVGGTNGKGSTVALLESILIESGLNVGSYSSPHLIEFNERIRFNHDSIDSSDLVFLFQAIEKARDDIELTFFEFTTLAALKYFHDKKIHIAILEVGLGGRLDAVNAFPSDYAIITNVSLDHMDWLGNTRERIAYEKSGLLKKGMKAVYGETDVPQAIEEKSKILRQLFIKDRDYTVSLSNDCRCSYKDIFGNNLSVELPDFGGQEQLENLGSVLALCVVIQKEVGIDLSKIGSAIKKSSIKGRLEKIQFKGRSWLLDVAHNAASARNLLKNIKSYYSDRKIIALTTILQDKEASQIISTMSEVVDRWIFIDIDYERAFTGEQLAALVSKETDKSYTVAYYNEAVEMAIATTAKTDLLLVFGSFYLVGPILSQLSFNKLNRN
jgi:dihydrofolate synthase/folylpolyglutamate synthase